MDMRKFKCSESMIEDRAVNMAFVSQGIYPSRSRVCLFMHEVTKINELPDVPIENKAIEVARRLNIMRGEHDRLVELLDKPSRRNSI